MKDSQTNNHQSGHFISKEEADITYPQLYNVSAGFMYRFLPRPIEHKQPEFLYVPNKTNSTRLSLLISQWNMAWEAGQLRKEIFLNGELFKNLDEETSFTRKSLYNLQNLLKLLNNQNIYLIPDTTNRFETYLPLYSLLPVKTLQRFDLPLLRRPIWPAIGMVYPQIQSLPNSTKLKLERAFASFIWPFINSGSPLQAFGKDEPIKLLSYNLDFWVPHITMVVEDRLRSFDLVELEKQNDIEDLKKIQDEFKFQKDSYIDRCRKGGHIWCGEDEAFEVAKELISKADSKGNLRAIIDSIRSNRVEEDFSDRWSYAREDFERKLYNKRQKIKVKFVELDYSELENKYGVVGPDSDISETLLWEGFFSLLDLKEKQIVVCLRKGVTKLTDIAKEMEYTNHSPVSKALTRIRQKARKYLES